MTGSEQEVLSLEHELEHELWRGPLGACWAGHVVRGPEAGRAVVVRRVRGLGAKTRALFDAARRASRVTHPSVVKLLGALIVEDELRLIHERISSIALRDLTRQLWEQGTVLKPSVAVRMVHDALLATSALRTRLRLSAAAARSARSLLPDTAVVADFGETLLTDPGIAGALSVAVREQAGAELTRYLAPEDLARTESEVRETSEVFTAGAILWELLAGSSLPDGTEAPPLASISRLGLPIPAPLALIVARALSPRPEARPPTAAEFAAELAGLGPLFATTDAVRLAMAPYLSNSSPAHAPADPNDPQDRPEPSTLRPAPSKAPVAHAGGASRASAAPQRDTLRPPVLTVPREAAPEVSVEFLPRAPRPSAAIERVSEHEVLIATQSLILPVSSRRPQRRMTWLLAAAGAGLTTAVVAWLWTRDRAPAPEASSTAKVALPPVTAPVTSAANVEGPTSTTTLATASPASSGAAPVGGIKPAGQRGPRARPAPRPKSDKPYQPKGI